MKNKKAITHIEAILSILIFVSGIVMVVILTRPIFISSRPTEAQINSLEQEFKEKTKSGYDVVFYTKIKMDCYGNVIVEEELPYYKVYAKQEEMVEIISQCGFNENKYTFPMRINIYDYNLIDPFIDSFESKDFKIIIEEETWGGTPPKNIPIKAKEIEIKLLKDSEIHDANVLLQVW